MQPTGARTRRHGAAGPSQERASSCDHEPLPGPPLSPPISNQIECLTWKTPRTTRARTQLQRREDAGCLLQGLPSELLSLLLSHLPAQALVAYAPLCRAMWLAAERAAEL
eukprot:4829600-Prymnesium_polylepis.1